LEKDGFDIVPAFFVHLEDFQTIPPGLGSASENAGKFLDFSFVIPSGNVGGDFDLSNEPGHSDGVLALVSMKQG
jgi:hypothetical protein